MQSRTSGACWAMASSTWSPTSSRSHPYGAYCAKTLSMCLPAGAIDALVGRVHVQLAEADRRPRRPDRRPRPPASLFDAGRDRDHRPLRPARPARRPSTWQHFIQQRVDLEDRRVGAPLRDAVGERRRRRPLGEQARSRFGSALETPRRRPGPLARLQDDALAGKHRRDRRVHREHRARLRRRGGQRRRHSPHPPSTYPHAPPTPSTSPIEYMRWIAAVPGSRGGPASR